MTLQWNHLEGELEGATSAELVLENVNYADALSYYCVVMNVAGTIYSDTADLLDFLANLGCEGCDCVGDLNGDCLVNITDLLWFLTLFN